MVDHRSIDLVDANQPIFKVPRVGRFSGLRHQVPIVVVAERRPVLIEEPVSRVVGVADRARSEPSRCLRLPVSDIIVDEGFLVNEGGEGVGDGF